VSWGVYLMPVKVLTGCSGLATDLSEGIIWAADHGANVINLSVQFNLTQQAQVTTMQDAVNYAHDRGVLLVAATGNNDNCSNGLPPANDTVCYPARMLNVMAVSATDNNDALGTFSNYGAELDVAAPGKDIRSTWTNGGYQFLFGTSMAAPHVSGLAALIKSYVPELTNDQIEEIIETSAEDRGALGWDDHFGFGRINAHFALLAAAQWPGILESSPPDTAIDAGQPFDRNTLASQGWSNIEIRFPRDAGGVASSDFVVVQTAPGTAPVISAIESLEIDRVRVVLDRPIDPLAWTTITHVATGSRVRLGFLPADASGDGFTSPADILTLIDSLNDVAPRPVWSTDIDRSGVAAPADILGLIDLLNGVFPYPSFNGASLPPMP
jgi:subtilisin family serine protease